MPMAIGRGYRPFDTFRFVGFFGAWDFGAMGLGLGQRYIMIWWSLWFGV